MSRFAIVFVCAGFVVSCGAEAPDASLARQTAPIEAVDALVVNECQAGKAGYVELFNGGSAPLDLGSDPNWCWYVDDVLGGGPPKRVTLAIAAGQRAVVDYAWVNYASDDACRLVRSVKTTAGCDAVLIEHDAGPTRARSIGECFGRTFDGGPWSDEAIACTPNAGSNGPALAPRVVINEFSPGSSGWVELYNAGDAEADLSGYLIDDIADGGTKPKTIPAGTLLAPGARLVISYWGINTASADEVRLVDTGSGAAGPGDATSNHWQGSSISGLCFARMPDGGEWANEPRECSENAPNLPPAGQAAVVVSLGVPNALILRGTIVTPAGPIDGEVLVESDVITCVDVSCSGQSQSGTPSVVETNGVVLPGMIDTHNHILFDIFDETDWTPPKAYQNHDQWPNDPRYKAMVDAKQYLNGEYGSSVNVGCELNKYGELKGLVSGTTSIVGAANPGNKTCYGSLARTIDQSQNDLGYDKVQAGTLMPSTKSADAICGKLASGGTDAYLIHAGEGVDQHALAEYEHLRSVPTADGCLHAHQTAIVHGTAFGANEFAEMGARGMSLVWSPRSNVFLYGQGTDLSKTTDIPLALAHGINVSLAPDWSIGGSQNLLDELRFADQVNAARFENLLSPEDLFEMVTLRAARVLGLEHVLGSIAVGKKADLMVIGRGPGSPYEALLAARARDVRMVIVGGVTLYGDTPLVAVAPAEPGCEPLSVCGSDKFVCVAEAGGSAYDKLGQTLGEIETVLGTELASYDALDLSAWDFSPIAPIVKCD